MRANEFLLEYRASGLYHSTSWYDALRIWDKDEFRANTSFTRMWTYAAGYARGMGDKQAGYAIFALDADKIRSDMGRRQMQGYDWFADKDPEDAEYYQPRNWSLDTDRAEERNRKPMPVKKYLAHLDIWVPMNPNLRVEGPLLAAWQDMQKDPKVKVHSAGAFPAQQQGVRIDPRRQYDSSHPAYGS